jgi:hypothetical protein
MDRGAGYPSRRPKWRQPLKRSRHACSRRSYAGQGASEGFDVLGQRDGDVKSLIGGVPGFVSYAAFRSGDGGVTVTVCEDQAGTAESSRRAAEFVKDNVGTTGDPPVITEGSTVLQFSS